MNKKPSISFFCPAYNDEENLPILIPKTISVLKEVCTKFEIVIIDDASPDRTGEMADKLAEQYKPHVKVIHHKINKGYGGALRSGFIHAKKYPYVFYTDGDNQYNVNSIKQFLRYIDKYDVVLGTRKMRELSLMRKFQSITYNWIIRLLFSVKTNDVNCAIRLIKRDFINKINLSSTSAFLAAEMIIDLQKRGATIKTVEVIHYPRIHGKASGGKLSVILPTITDMLKYFLNKTI